MNEKWQAALAVVTVLAMWGVFYLDLALWRRQQRRMAQCEQEIIRLHRSWDEMLLMANGPYLALLEGIDEERRTPAIENVITSLKRLETTLKERLAK